MARMDEFRIKRQDAPDANPYWEDFLVSYKPGMNVIAALM
jgi:succinate dehydrogenase / fumarate reductase iron-sulfur subunit